MLRTLKEKPKIFEKEMLMNFPLSVDPSLQSISTYSFSEINAGSLKKKFLFLCLHRLRSEASVPLSHSESKRSKLSTCYASLFESKQGASNENEHLKENKILQGLDGVKQQKSKILKDYGAVENFWNECFDKSQLKAFVFWFLKTYGENKTVSLLERLKDCGFKYATKAGVSISIDDMMIPSSKSLLITQAEKEVFKTILHYKRGKITGVERFQKLIDTWHRTSELLKQEVIHNFEKTDTLNPLYMMAFSGARGNVSQVRQLVGMRGLMANPQGQIIDFPIRSNFREGLTLTEYIISSYGARKGIVDTALRTANAGYLTRRLVDVAQHVIIAQFDCGTERGIFVRELKESNKCLYSLQNRLIGRILAKDLVIVQNTRSVLLGQRNQEISAELSSRIALSFQRVFIRSPLTCQTKKLVCQLCYGWSLAQGNLVSIGEAIGIIAAQSIGEPGTQLTMRTFHTGGVFSGDLTDQIIAPFNGSIEYSGYIPGTLIRTSEGTLAFLTKSEGSFFLRQKKNPQMSLEKEPKFYKIPAYTVLFLRNKENFFEKQVLAQISLFSKQKKQRDNEERSMRSELEGEVFHGHLDLLEQINDYQEKKSESWDWGYIWVLAAKIYKFPVQSYLFPKLGDFVTMQSGLNRIRWFLSESCLLVRIAREAEPARKTVVKDFLVTEQVLPSLKNPFFSYASSTKNKVVTSQQSEQSKPREKVTLSNKHSTTFFPTSKKKRSKLEKGNKVVDLQNHILLKKTLLDFVLQKICYRKLGYFVIFKNFNSAKLVLETQAKFSRFYTKRLSFGIQKRKPSFIAFHFSQLSSIKKEKTGHSFSILKYNSSFITFRKNHLTSQNNLHGHHKKVIDWFFTKFLLLIHSFRIKSTFVTNWQDTFFTPLSIHSNTQPTNFLKKKLIKNRMNKKQSTSNWSPPSNFLMLYSPAKYQIMAPGLFRFFCVRKESLVVRKYSNSSKVCDLLPKTTMGNLRKDFEGKNNYHIYSKNSSDLRRILYVYQPFFHLKTLDFVKKISSPCFSQKKLGEISRNKQKITLLNISYNHSKSISSMSPIFLQTNRQGTSQILLKNNSVGLFAEKHRENTENVMQHFSGFVQVRRLKMSPRFLNHSLSSRKWTDNNRRKKLYRPMSQSGHSTSVSNKYSVLLQSKILKYLKQKTTKQIFNATKKLCYFKNCLEWLKKPLLHSVESFHSVSHCSHDFAKHSESIALRSERSKQGASESSEASKKIKTATDLNSKNYFIHVKNHWNMPTVLSSIFLASKVSSEIKNSFLQTLPKILLNRKKFSDHQKHELKMTLKKGWVYLPLNQLAVHACHKVWIQSGNPICEDLIFDKHITYTEVLNTKFPKKMIQNSESQNFTRWVKRGTSRYQPFPFTSIENTRLYLHRSLLARIAEQGASKATKEEKLTSNALINGQQTKFYTTELVALFQSGAFSNVPINVFTNSFLLLIRNVKQYYLPKIEQFKNQISNHKTQNQLSQNLTFQNYHYLFLNKQQKNETFLPKFPNIDLKIQSLLFQNIRFDGGNQKHYKNFLCKIQKKKPQDQLIKTMNDNREKKQNRIPRVREAKPTTSSENFLRRFPLRHTSTKFSNLKETRTVYFSTKALNLWALEIRFFNSSQFSSLFKFPEFRLNPIGNLDLSKNFIHSKEFFQKARINFWSYLLFKNNYFTQYQSFLIGSLNFKRSPITQFFISPPISGTLKSTEELPLLKTSKSHSEEKCLKFPFIKTVSKNFQAASSFLKKNTQLNFKEIVYLLRTFPYLLPLPSFSLSLIQIKNDLLNPRISGSYDSRQGNETSFLKRPFYSLKKNSYNGKKTFFLQTRPHFSPIFPAVKNQLFITKKNLICPHSFFATTSFLSPYIGEILDSSLVTKSLSQPFISNQLITNSQLILTLHDLISFSLTQVQKPDGSWKQASDVLKGIKRTKRKNFARTTFNQLHFFDLNPYVYPFRLSPSTLQRNLSPLIFLDLLPLGYFFNKPTKQFKQVKQAKEVNIKQKMKPVVHKEISDVRFKVQTKKNNSKIVPLNVKTLQKYINICQAILPCKTSAKKVASIETKKRNQGKLFPSYPPYLTQKTNKSFWYQNSQKKEFEQVRKTSSTIVVIKFKEKTYQVNNLHLSYFSKKNHSKTLISLGKFMFYGDFFSINDISNFRNSNQISFGTSAMKKLAINQAGLLIHINFSKLTLRKGQPFFVSPKAILHQSNGEFVQKRESVVTLAYQRVKTGDIVQGIPKIEQIFEARTTKRGRLFRDSLPNMLENIFLRYKYRLTQEKAVRQSYYKIRQIIVDGVQRVYRSQGVSIADKHIEVIVKEMTSKVRIINRGVTAFFPGELVDLDFVENLNLKFIKKIKYEPLVLGISKASLSADSFLSSASFQHTIRVLSQAAIYKKHDFLRGLKENVIVGNLIPAGTGFLTRLDDEIKRKSASNYSSVF